MEDHPDPSITQLYTIQDRLGKGAYGIVWKAIDKATGEVVAIKKIFDAFRDETDAQRTFREIQYLQWFVDHPNIISLLNVLKADNDKDIYLVFDHMDTDLFNARRILKPAHLPYIMYQLIAAINYMHSGGVIHRDLKPQNVLVNDECLCKLADFGLARSIIKHGGEDYLDTGVMTDYVATRWYRSPEILLGSKRYTSGTDMWSIGCILGELLGGQAIFRGENSYKQVEIIVQTIGKPSAADIKACQFSAMIDLTRLPGKLARKSFGNLFPKANPMAVDLLKKLLVFNPDKRITAAEALQHPYLKGMFDSNCEITLPGPVTAPVDDSSKLTIRDYRTRLYKEIRERCAEQAMIRNSPSPTNSPLREMQNKTPVEEDRQVFERNQPPPKAMSPEAAGSARSSRAATSSRNSWGVASARSPVRSARSSRPSQTKAPAPAAAAAPKRSGTPRRPSNASTASNAKGRDRPSNTKASRTIVDKVAKGVEIMDVYGYPTKQRTTPPKVYKHKAGAWEEKPPARPAADVWTAEDEMPAESVAPSRSPTRYSQRANSRDTRDPLQFEPLEGEMEELVLTDVYGQSMSRKKTAHSKRNDSNIFAPDPEPSMSRYNTAAKGGYNNGRISTRVPLPTSDWRERPTGLGRAVGGAPFGDGGSALSMSGQRATLTPRARPNNSSHGLPWASPASTRPW